ncbi:MAG: gluconeogenesis factor YvcK family protein [Candidatus Saccharimonadales bacterium]
MVNKRPHIVVIGGGTGSFTILNGLKQLECNLTALVNMVDSGGSTGQLRDEYGVLPPGDVRQCLVALSEAPEPLRNLFNFRFPAGSALEGHSFGNLFLSAVEMMTDNFLQAVSMASEVLNIKGQVLPVTTEKCQLVMNLGSNRVIGQAKIDETRLERGYRPQLALLPKAVITPEAQQVLSEADLIIIAPGNLYSSIIPTLLVDGVSEGLKNDKAKVVYICNLVNKPNNTWDFTVSDYTSEIERFAGDGVLDYVIYNTDTPSKALLGKYAQDNEYPVIIDEEKLESASYRAIPSKLLSHKAEMQDKNDVLLKRTLLRHDSTAVKREIARIIKEIR